MLELETCHGRERFFKVKTQMLMARYTAIVNRTFHNMWGAK
jgi:hypothetical protein